MKGADATQKASTFEAEFDVQPDCDPMEQARTAKTAVALHRLVTKKSLGPPADYYESRSGHEYEDFITSAAPC